MVKCIFPIESSTFSTATACLVRSLVHRRFTAFATSSTLIDSECEQEEDKEEWESASCIIQDKDFLRKSKKTRAGLQVLDLIDQGSLDPDPILYNRLVSKCTQLRKVREGRLVHAHFLNSDFKDDIVILNTILNMYGKCGLLEDAHKMFDRMPHKDMVTWTTLITAYSQHDRPNDALVLFPQMLLFGFSPNQFTLSSLLKASAVVGPSDGRGRQLHAFCIKWGYYSNVYVGSSIVDMYARYGLMDEARFAFDGLLIKNEVSWNALIAGYARKGDGESTLLLFWKMLRQPFWPTHFTYSSMFSACAATGALEQGRWIHAHMLKTGLKLIAFVGNTLLDMYAKSGSIDDATKVFNRLLKPDVVSWNSMLTGCAQHGLGRDTVKRFEEMLRMGIKPNQITFLCVLTACSHSGLLSEGLHYFEMMKEHNLELEVAHYVTIVDLFGRAGLLNRAEAFIKEMPMKPTAAVWGALLGACRMHKNMELGTYAAERVFELDPHDSGPHILLSNIYASAGRWRDAAKVRKMMRLSGVKKEPACSWVEMENAVHMFVANDVSHPRIVEIRRVWEEVRQRIREIGYVPDLNHVLLFVDQWEREARLQHHSEKLALAFALLSTPPGSTIRIKKNIRVCADCHSAIKFASRVTQREIILRDTNRFHHFRDGSCSCGDYW